MPNSLYSLFFLTLVNYDGDDSKLAKKGWLDLDRQEKNTMQDIFTSKYGFYAIFVFSCQWFLTIVLLIYNINSVGTNLKECIS